MIFFTFSTLVLFIFMMLFGKQTEMNLHRLRPKEMEDFELKRPWIPLLLQPSMLIEGKLCNQCYYKYFFYVLTQPLNYPHFRDEETSKQKNLITCP